MEVRWGQAQLFALEKNLMSSFKYRGAWKPPYIIYPVWSDYAYFFFGGRNSDEILSFAGGL